MPRRSSLIAAAVLLGWTVAALLVDPRADVPLIDDWIYAASVERLVAGGGLHFVAWTSAIPIAQIVWAAPFALVTGVSYTALRVSTLVLAALGLLAFFALLRVLGVDERRAGFAAATLALYPVWFVLSFTFMTDVPFVALVLASACALVVGLRQSAREGEPAASARRRRFALRLGLVLATVAFLIRPVAIAIPAALFLVALRAWRSSPTGAPHARTAAAAVAAVMAMAAAAIVVGRLWPTAGGDGGLAYRVVRLRYVFLVSPIVYLEALLSMIAHLGLAALPALVLTAPPPARWPWRLGAVILVAAAVATWFAPTPVLALKPGATWSAQELGAARPLLQAFPEPDTVRATLAAAMTLIGLFAGACLIARPVAAWRERVASQPWAFLGAYMLVSVGMCFVLWFFYDRYFLPLVPVAIAVAIATGRMRPTAVQTAAATALLVILALLDVSGTRDMLAYARAVGGAIADLRRQGVAEHRIDAGYVENGWRLYAHPQNLAPGQDPDRDVPNLSGTARWPFVVANGPVVGYAVEREISVPTWWAQGDRIYVLRQPDAPVVRAPTRERLRLASLRGEPEIVRACGSRDSDGFEVSLRRRRRWRRGLRRRQRSAVACNVVGEQRVLRLNRLLGGAIPEVETSVSQQVCVGDAHVVHQLCADTIRRGADEEHGANQRGELVDSRTLRNSFDLRGHQRPPGCELFGHASTFVQGDVRCNHGASARAKNSSAYGCRAYTRDTFVATPVQSWPKNPLVYRGSVRPSCDRRQWRSIRVRRTPCAAFGSIRSTPPSRS